jgi:ABC-2 type transport system permease protein
LLPVPAQRLSAVVNAVAGLSFLSHFSAISKGVIDIRDLLYFLLVTAAWLYATAIVLEMKKAQ